MIHARDADAMPGAEQVLTGEGETTLAADLVAIPTPGHTAGHCVALWRGTHLFSGDHLWWSRRLGALNASREVCWHSWTEQTASVRRLADLACTWVLPGHGERRRDDRGGLPRRDARPGGAHGARPARVLAVTLRSKLARLGAQGIADLEEQQLHAIQKAWLQAFCQEVKARRGRWIHNGSMWHAFSFDYCACLRGLKALAAYERVQGGPCYAFNEDMDTGCGFTATAGPPDLTSSKDDWYVCAQDMGWTMVFTHEQPELGPFFAKNPRL